MGLTRKIALISDLIQQRHQAPAGLARGDRMDGHPAHRGQHRVDPPRSPAGVPCEISDPDFVMGLFDDRELRAKGWVTSYEHASVGNMDVFGLLFDFDQTPGVVQRPAPMVGAHSREILRELGYTDVDIDGLVTQGVVLDTARGGS